MEKRIKNKYQVEILSTFISYHTTHRTTRGHVYYKYAMDEMEGTSRNGCEIFGRNSNGSERDTTSGNVYEEYSNETPMDKQRANERKRYDLGKWLRRIFERKSNG